MDLTWSRPGARAALPCLLGITLCACSFEESPLASGASAAEDAGGRDDGSSSGSGGHAGSTAGAGASGRGGSGGTGGASGVSGSAGGAGMTGGAGSGSGGASSDAGIDAGMDAAIDAGLDAGEDAGMDGGEDSGLDTAMDAGVDAGMDAGPTQVCVPLSEEDCYSGPDGTLGVGACHAGKHTCRTDGSGYGACNGEVTPSAPACGDDEDLDCDGAFDVTQGVDQDGDGYGTCDGDCCDGDTECADPERVNPGAYDFAADGVDDDCSGAADDADTCDGSLASDSSDFADYAAAIDLCSRTTLSPPLAERRWGVLSASFTLSDGTGSPALAQRSIRPDFGAIAVQRGARLLVLSSGTAAAIGDGSPAYAAPSPGTDQGTTSTAPAVWLDAHGGAVPSVGSCPGQTDKDLYDPIMLTLFVRVPTNAQAFSVRAYFLTAEFPEWVCGLYNDHFVALLGSSYSGVPANPDDHNLATYPDAKDELFPISVNTDYGNTGLLQQCVNGPTGCGASAAAGTTSTCTGVADLAGTGFDADAKGLCDGSAIVGAGSGWLNLSGNVVPGETIQLRFAIWDNGDATGDSHVLLDAFTWLPDPVAPGTGR